MGNRALRRELGKAIKEAGVGKLYTCSRKRAFYFLSRGSFKNRINVTKGHNRSYHVKYNSMRDLIKLIAVKPGFVTHEWGVNQRVKSACKISYADNGFRHNMNGRCVLEVDQFEYESGYMSCGCGNWGCFGDNPIKSKAEIVASLKHQIESPDPNWGPSGAAKHYDFALKTHGVDIIDDEGFLITNWNDYVKDMPND